MSVVIVTGSSGLVGSETSRYFHARGLEVVGIDNDMRRYFFGEESSTARNALRLTEELPRFTHAALDIRDSEGVSKIFARYGRSVACVVHAAAQPSHDWAAKEPLTDFTVNANGSLVLLEAARRWAPDAVFIFTSTNKVYGDTPNRLPFVEKPLRWELDASHPYAANGIDEQMSIDHSMHSLFGASKIAADILVQEYGRYFGLKTGIFRCGCLTGPAQQGAELHGFLSYLVRCVVRGRPYTVFGYRGKQVRDNIHSADLVSAFWSFFRAPRAGAVYNMGGSRQSNISVLEAIRETERLSGMKLNYRMTDEPRAGDHIWWISDVGKFRSDYPAWRHRYDINMILGELVEAMREQRGASARAGERRPGNETRPTL